MIQTFVVAARDRERLSEIIRIATHYGLGMLLSKIGLDRSASAQDGTSDTDLPRRTRLALEELGPTFIKLGQILATRGDLLPPHWIAELEQLQNQAPTLLFDALRRDVEEALGQAPEMVFASFDTEPLAAASMAQVHRAVLNDGRPVVLKIRRPNIRKPMEADLRLIAHAAALAEKNSAEARRFAPAALVRQLAQAISEELDFTGEGRNADRLREDFSDNPRVIVPQIYWQWTSETLLVMDYIDGVAPRSGDALTQAGINPAAIADLGADLVMDMIFINGRFHADPHPGNLLCQRGDTIALLDMGMVGHVSPRRREELLGFILSLTSGNPAALADTLLIWSNGGGTHATRDQVMQAAERLVARHGGGPLVLGAVVADFLQLLRDEALVVPPDLFLIFKALMTIDGVLTNIQPGFDLSQAMARSRMRLLQDRLSPDGWTETAQALLMELSSIGKDAPRLLRAAIRRMEQPPAPPPPKGDMADAIRTAGRWIAIAVVTGGAMIASALIWW